MLMKERASIEILAPASRNRERSEATRCSEMALKAAIQRHPVAALPVLLLSV